MSSKVLLDTNVMLDLALARPEGFDAAATIAEAVAYEEVVAYVCATSLKDLYYILSKAMGGEGRANLHQGCDGRFHYLLSRLRPLSSGCRFRRA